MDEVILIDKPQGLTSFGVVARLRRVLSNQAGKKVKVGHTGTLDPFATGLMIMRRRLSWERKARRVILRAKLPKCLTISRV